MLIRKNQLLLSFGYPFLIYFSCFTEQVDVNLLNFAFVNVNVSITSCDMKLRYL